MPILTVFNAHNILGSEIRTMYFLNIYIFAYFSSSTCIFISFFLNPNNYGWFFMYVLCISVFLLPESTQNFLGLKLRPKFLASVLGPIHYCNKNCDTTPICMYSYTASIFIQCSKTSKFILEINFTKFSWKWFNEKKIFIKLFSWNFYLLSLKNKNKWFSAL